MTRRLDVVVVGAGPVGLLLAIELALGGAEVVVVERLTAPNRGIKAPSIGPLGAEALERRGMGPALAEAEARTAAAMGPAGVARRAQSDRSRGHFALLPLRSNAAHAPERRMRWVDQAGVEAILGERVAALAIEVRRGCEVTAVEQTDEGVEVGWTGPDGANHARCAWLVGCDGGHSTIRDRAGFAFRGTPPSLTLYQAVLEPIIRNASRPT